MSLLLLQIISIYYCYYYYLLLLFVFPEGHRSAQEGLGDSQEREFQEGTPQETGPDEDEEREFKPGDLNRINLS
jgi:hypothetical protein